MFRPLHRRGFTLIELLIVITILGLLAGMLAMALVNTQQSAREARTRATITKLHTLIAAKWDSYATRRVPVTIAANQTNVRTIAQTRLNGLRDLMRLELPDRITDFMSNQSVINALPSVTRSYQRIYNTKKIGNKNPDDREYESAECLYLIIAYGLREEDALSQFSEDEIGDFDGDGLKEFLDGWGQPIAFIRWAPQADSTLINRDAQTHHDPFDPLKVVQNAYALFPLIYSAGQDKIYDIQTKDRPTANDPYSGTAGRSEGNGSFDNLTNHELLTP